MKQLPIWMYVLMVPGAIGVIVLAGKVFDVWSEMHYVVAH